MGAEDVHFLEAGVNDFPDISFSYMVFHHHCPLHMRPSPWQYPQEMADVPQNKLENASLIGSRRNFITL